MGLSTLCLANVSAGRGRQRAAMAVGAWQRTLQDLEVLKVLVLGVHIELDPRHGHIDCERGVSGHAIRR